jgi:alkylation response protein AidB-like acyl-CoA dehydrogenase
MGVAGEHKGVDAELSILLDALRHLVRIAQKRRARPAAQFATGAAERDREGLLPIEEIDAYPQSGLCRINVPKAYGAEVSYATLAEVTKIIAAADPSIAQITRNHLANNPHIDADASEEHKRYLFGEVLKSIHFGNAFSEKNSNLCGGDRDHLGRRRANRANPAELPLYHRSHPSRRFGGRSASATKFPLALDRHWRNARTLASHNPRIYKERIVGDYAVNGTPPPYQWRIGLAPGG